MNRANYATGKLAGKTVRVLLDTGAGVSLVSARVYHALAGADKPKLQPAGPTLRMADGSPMRAHGVADFKLQLGDQCTQHTYTVADTEPDVIVGIDFLAKHCCEWRRSDNSLVVDGGLVPLEGPSCQPVVTRVQVAVATGLVDTSQGTGELLTWTARSVHG